jgi:hypothetical protein
MNWGPFEEKKGGGFSMSRLIAFGFAVTYCYALTLVARNTGPSTIMGWPYACLGIVVVMAVPLQALFNTLQSWFSSAPGKALIATLVGKATAGLETKLTTTSTVATGATPPTDSGDK